MLVNKTVAAVLNNPVHLVDGDGKLSPSAFIPFCEWGGDPHIMGKKIDEFDLPVCTSFTEKIHNGQLCYGVNVNNFKTKGTFRSEDLRLGLTLLLDYNSERALRRFEKNKYDLVAKGSISKPLIDSREREEALIRLDTISKFVFQQSLDIVKISFDTTGRIYPVALPQTQVRFVPGNIDGPRFDPRTVGQSVPDSVTLPLLCEEQ